MSGKLKHKRYSVKMAYPKPKVENINITYGDILLDDYAGVVSELSAINLYVYQHIISDKIFKQYAEAIRRISIVEMRHLELLGETIRLLGVKPVFISSFAPSGQIWTAGYINYADNLLEMILLDIESEKQAIAKYEEHINLIDDRYIRRLLRRIIMDEQLHIKIFKRLYNKYSR